MSTRKYSCKRSGARRSSRAHASTVTPGSGLNGNRIDEPIISDHFYSRIHACLIRQGFCSTVKDEIPRGIVMDTYWLRLAEASAPHFALMAISILPSAIGIAIAAFNLRIANQRGYHSALSGSIASSITSALMLAPVLLGTDPSPMAALRFFSVPFLSLLALFVGIALGARVYDKKLLSMGGGVLVLPLLVVLLVVIGIGKVAMFSAEEKLARSALHPEVLHAIAGRVERGGQAMRETASLLAQNPNAPADVLGELASHADSDVRLHVAKNPSTPDAVLAVLCQDPNASVRQLATQRQAP